MFTLNGKRFCRVANGVVGVGEKARHHADSRYSLVESIELNEKTGDCFIFLKNGTVDMAEMFEIPTR